jgi:hypothetical protein
MSVTVRRAKPHWLTLKKGVAAVAAAGAAASFLVPKLASSFEAGPPVPTEQPHARGQRAEDT